MVRSSSSLHPEAARAKFERLWLLNPEQFNPERCALERLRVQRTWEVLKALLPVEAFKATDLGFGWGTLTRQLQEKGAQVDAVDIAGLALAHYEKMAPSSARLLREAVPHTSLLDSVYDVVLCTELIAELSPGEQRLLISEMYRLVKPEGYVVFSSALDIDSDGALNRLITLAETELSIEELHLSYHSDYLRLFRLLRAPAKRSQARQDPRFRQEQLDRRGHLSQKWFQWQLQQPLYSLWWVLDCLTRPLSSWIEQSESLATYLEKSCRFFKPERGISHVIVVAKKKALQESAETQASTLARPLQRLRERVWE